MSRGREITRMVATTTNCWTGIQLDLCVLHDSSGPVANLEPMYNPSRKQLLCDTTEMLQIQLLC